MYDESREEAETKVICKDSIMLNAFLIITTFIYLVECYLFITSSFVDSDINRYLKSQTTQM